MEERNLLNPAFCAMLLWHAARGYAKENKDLMPIEWSFLVLPLVLPLSTRVKLLEERDMSLSEWCDKCSAYLDGFGKRAKLLCSHTREALVFGGLHGLLDVSQGGIGAKGPRDRKKSVHGILRDRTSNDVRDCAKCAKFLGELFIRTRNPARVMHLLGVQS